METLETQPVHNLNDDYHANVDTSRAFRSVKEAVAIFGERLLLGETFSSRPKPVPYTNSIVQTNQSPSPWKKSTSPQSNSSYGDDVIQDDKVVMDALRKLEAELEETKVELKQLKERESETEVALASLNAELHKNMSKLARAEAAAAAKASIVLERSSSSPAPPNNMTAEESKYKKEWMMRMEESASLAKIFSIGTDYKEGHYGNNKKMPNKKQKPIVPLVQDLFAWKKRSSSPLHDSLYSSPQLYY